MSKLCCDEPVALAVISPEAGLQKKLAEALEQSHGTESLWTLSEYPAPSQLSPLRQAAAGCVVLLDFTDPRRAKSVAAELDHSYPNVTTIALYPQRRTAQDLVNLMQLGIREVVDLPLTMPDVLQAVTRVSRKMLSRRVQERSLGRIYAFLPGKPGAGATTIATNTAVSVARFSNQKTLLIDFNLKAGMTTFLLKLDGQNSVMDALTAASSLDATLWDRLVSRLDNLEVLGSAPAEIGQVPPPGSATQVLKFAQQYYETICVDLPSDVSDWEQETLALAREVFLVCSPDLGVLHMAKRRSEQLRSLGLEGTISVIMNRADSRGSFPIADIEKILQLPVSYRVPSDYVGIAEATTKGVPIYCHSSVMSEIATIAHHLNPLGAPQQTKSRKFVEFFSVTPVRDRLAWRNS